MHVEIALQLIGSRVMYESIQKRCWGVWDSNYVLCNKQNVTIGNLSIYKIITNMYMYSPIIPSKSQGRY